MYVLAHKIHKKTFKFINVLQFVRANALTIYKYIDICACMYVYF